MEHTPTPWKAQYYNGLQELLVIAENEQVARILYTETRGLMETVERRKDNAEFIVRACNTHDELVGVLNQFIRWANQYEQAHGGFEKGSGTPLIREHARAAIAKVEGV